MVNGRCARRRSSALSRIERGVRFYCRAACGVARMARKPRHVTLERRIDQNHRLGGRLRVCQTATNGRPDEPLSCTTRISATARPTASAAARSTVRAPSDEQTIPIAVVALAVNLVSAWLLHDDDRHHHPHGTNDDHHHGHHHHDTNHRGAYVHLLADCPHFGTAIIALLAGLFPWRKLA